MLLNKLTNFLDKFSTRAITRFFLLLFTVAAYITYTLEEKTIKISCILGFVKDKLIDWLIEIQKLPCLYIWVQNIIWEIWYGRIDPKMLLPGALLFLIVVLVFKLSDILQKNTTDKQDIFFSIFNLALKMLRNLLIIIAVFIFWGDAEYINSIGTFNQMSYWFNFHTEPTNFNFNFQLLVVLSTLIILYASSLFFKFNKKLAFEFPIITLLMVFFLLCLIDSTDFFVSFICIIGFSLNVYVLILSNAQSKICCEAAIKYFYLSSIASGFIAFSLWLNYLTFFSLNFITIEETLKRWNFLSDSSANILLLSTHFLCYGLFFKLAAFPCHLWAASVYEGSPLPVMAFFVLPIKTAVLAFIFKVFYIVLKDIYHIYVYIFWFSSFFSLLFGALSALVEKKIRRFFAYSSINQMGFLLMGIIGGNSISLQASVLYLLIYVISNLGLFIILLNTFEVNTKRTLLYLTDFTSFSNTNSFGLAIVLTILLFSMAGIPPLAGFFGKYYLFLALYTSKFYSLILTGMFTSLLSAYYYLKIIKQMLFDSRLKTNTVFFMFSERTLFLKKFSFAPIKILLTLIVYFLILAPFSFDFLINQIWDTSTFSPEIWDLFEKIANSTPDVEIEPEIEPEKPSSAEESVNAIYLIPGDGACVSGNYNPDDVYVSWLD